MLKVNEEEIAALLGSKYDAWKAYKRELPSRLQVTDLKVLLAANDAPLSDSQARSLLDGLVQLQTQHDQDASQSRFGPDYANSLVTEASRYLDPAQLEIYRQMLKRQGVDKERSFFSSQSRRSAGN